MFAALLIVEILMSCIFNQINGAFHNYLSLYIGDDDNNTAFVRSYCLFDPLGRTAERQGQVAQYVPGHKNLNGNSSI